MPRENLSVFDTPIDREVLDEDHIPDPMIASVAYLSETQLCAAVAHDIAYFCDTLAHRSAGGWVGGVYREELVRFVAHPLQRLRVQHAVDLLILNGYLDLHGDLVSPAGEGQTGVDVLMDFRYQFGAGDFLKEDRCTI